MGCPKNPKKFLGVFPYEGKHDLELKGAHYLMFLTCEYECRRCGCRQDERLIDDEEMVRRGYDLKKIREKQGDDLTVLRLTPAELEECKEGAA